MSQNKEQDSRIIFLDIDGVLNCQLFYTGRDKRGELPYPLSEICAERIGMLNDLCEETGAKVVISSTWRHKGMESCINILRQRGATFDVIGITPDLRADSVVRGNEIHAWIDTNSKLLFDMEYYDFKTYVIIDDDSDMLLWQREHFFQTDNYSGLTPNTCHKIKLFFQRTRNTKQFKDNE